MLFFNTSSLLQRFLKMELETRSQVIFNSTMIITCSLDRIRSSQFSCGYNLLSEWVQKGSCTAESKNSWIGPTLQTILQIIVFPVSISSSCIRSHRHWEIEENCRGEIQSYCDQSLWFIWSIESSEWYGRNHFSTDVIQTHSILHSRIIGRWKNCNDLSIRRHWWTSIYYLVNLSPSSEELCIQHRNLYSQVYFLAIWISGDESYIQWFLNHLQCSDG